MLQLRYIDRRQSPADDLYIQILTSYNRGWSIFKSNCVDSCRFYNLNYIDSLQIDK